MKLPLAYYGDPILRKKAAPVTEITKELRQLVLDMKETMLANNGWALAAPQIHRSIALFISLIPYKQEDGEYIDPTEIKVYINPKILSVSDEEMVVQDGCLSIPHLKGTVGRPYQITIEATDLEGKRFTEELFDYQAFGALHENDHLNGVLFIDRMDDPRERRAIEPQLRAVKKKYQSK